MYTYFLEVKIEEKKMFDVEMCLVKVEGSMNLSGCCANKCSNKVNVTLKFCGIFNALITYV